MNQRLQLAPWHVATAGISACVLLALLGIVTIIRPVQRDQQRLTELRARLESLEGQRSIVDRSRSTLEDELRRLREELEARPLKLESAAFLNSRLNALVEVATESQLRIDQTQSGDQRGGEWFDVISIRLSGNGSYSDCAAFLHKLHDSLPDVAVVSFELAGEPQASRSPSSFRFDLDWYAAPSFAAAD